jgi:hypothetical protein
MAQQSDPDKENDQQERKTRARRARIGVLVTAVWFIALESFIILPVSSVAFWIGDLFCTGLGFPMLVSAFDYVKDRLVRLPALLDPESRNRAELGRELRPFSVILGEHIESALSTGAGYLKAAGRRFKLARLWEAKPKRRLKPDRKVVQKVVTDELRRARRRKRAQTRMAITGGVAAATVLTWPILLVVTFRWHTSVAIPLVDTGLAASALSLPIFAGQRLSRHPQGEEILVRIMNEYREQQGGRARKFLFVIGALVEGMVIADTYSLREKLARLKMTALPRRGSKRHLKESQGAMEEVAGKRDRNAQTLTELAERHAAKTPGAFRRVVRRLGRGTRHQ